MFKLVGESPVTAVLWHPVIVRALIIGYNNGSLLVHKLGDSRAVIHIVFAVAHVAHFLLNRIDQDPSTTSPAQ